MKEGNSEVSDNINSEEEEKKKRWRKGGVNGRKIFCNCTKWVTRYNWDEALPPGRVK